MFILWQVLNPANWLFFIVIIALAVGAYYFNALRKTIFSREFWIGAGLFGIAGIWWGVAVGGQVSYSFFKVKLMKGEIASLALSNKQYGEVIDLRNKMLADQGRLIVELQIDAANDRAKNEALKEQFDDIRTTQNRQDGNDIVFTVCDDWLRKHRGQTPCKRRPVQ